MEKESIALIELGGSHDECLYSQILFLKKHGHCVHILLFRDHLDRIDKWEEVDNWKTYKPVSGFLSRLRLVLEVRAYLRKQRIRNAIINTAEGNIIRELTLLPGRGIKFTGLIHLSRKLWSSKSQRLINRKIKKYFVLADFISENLSQADPSLKISYFYPVYFPQNRPSGLPGNDIPHQDPEPVPRKVRPTFPKEFMVTIPGAVDFARRDYSSLMDEIISRGAPAGIRFVLLGRIIGRDGKTLVQRILKEGLENNFTWFEEFVKPGDFYDCLSRTDLVLPLITPGSLDFDDYLKYKITGTYNLAWGFKIPMMMHESMNEYEIFKKTSLFYANGQMLNTLEKINREMLDSIRNRIAVMRDFDFDVQAEKYIDFIRG